MRMRMSPSLSAHALDLHAWMGSLFGMAALDEACHLNLHPSSKTQGAEKPKDIA